MGTSVRAVKPLMMQRVELTPDENDVIYFSGSNDAEVAWYRDNSDRKTHQSVPRTQLFEVCDLTSNVSEWVFDRCSLYTSDEK